MLRDCILNTCKEQCEMSNMRSRHGAIILYRNKIVAEAFNIVRPQIRFPPYTSIHAEVHVVYKFLEKHPKEELQKATLFVIRLDREGHILNSKPCRYCAHFLDKHRVRKVFYSV
jgi:tRNA(Arg) A34 adenosine deaminase TadA